MPCQYETSSKHAQRSAAAQHERGDRADQQREAAQEEGHLVTRDRRAPAAAQADAVLEALD